MSRIMSAAIAALAASPLLLIQPETANARTAPEPIDTSERCQLYSNTLILMNEVHINGSLVLSPKELAQEAARGILEAGHNYVIEHAPTNADHGSVLNKDGKKNIISWTLKDKTIEAGDAPENIRTYADSCAYLNSVAYQVRETAGIPIFNLFEAATAAATSKAVPKDHHSGYLPKRAAEDMIARTRGDFGGIGMELKKEVGQPIIAENVMEDNPAAKGGILKGDKITHIDGNSVLYLTSDEVVALLRGTKGSTVKLTVQRDGAEPFDATLTRDTIVQKAVTGFLLKGTEIGVIKISTFNDYTTRQFLDVAEEIAKEAYLQGKSIKHFSIRVEDNPGACCRRQN
ncbi:MAG: PDZ domain-containing protein [Alphaproteobacteria bacterium]|nr:PDZ domain-containing protein [Alphaproteobacteria bacterium]